VTCTAIEGRFNTCALQPRFVRLEDAASAACDQACLESAAGWLARVPAFMSS